MDFFSWEYLKEKGNTFFRDKKYEEALTYYKKAILLNDRIEVLYSNKGTCEKCLQNYNQAILDYKKAIKINPSNAKNFNRLASVYLIIGELSEAYGLQKKALKIDPYNLSYKEQLDLINKMINEEEQLKTLEKKDNFDEIDKKLKDLNEKYQEMIFLKRRYILFLFKHLKFKEAKEFIYNNFSNGTIRKNNPEFGFLIGLLLYFNGEYKNAEEIITQIKNSGLFSLSKCEDLLYKIKNIESVKKKANNLYNQKEYEKAIQAYTKALDFDPINLKFNSVILVNRALCYEKINKYYDAVNDANLSLQLNPNYARGYIRRANAYIKLKNFKRAVEDFEKAKSIDPSFPGIESYLKDINIKVANLENELNSEKDIKQKLYKEIISLKNTINIKDNIIRDKSKQIEDLKNKQKDEFQNVFSKKSNYVDKDKIIELMQKLEAKEEMLRKKELEIKQMKSKYPFDLLNNEKLMIVKIESQKDKVNHSFLCKNTHKFIYLENLLYEIYPELTESDNFFLVNGLKINKFKTLEENNIKDNDLVLLNRIDDDEDDNISIHSSISRGLHSSSSTSSFSLGDSINLKDSFNDLSQSKQFCGFQFDKEKKDE